MNLSWQKYLVIARRKNVFAGDWETTKSREKQIKWVQKFVGYIIFNQKVKYSCLLWYLRCLYSYIYYFSQILNMQFLQYSYVKN